MIKITDLEHQNKVCNALVEYLEKRKGKDFTVIGIPDQMEKNVPAVDLWFKDPTGREYVLEHTLIESFPEQLRDKNAFERIFLPLEKELQDGLPGSEQYLLKVEADKIENTEKYEIAKANLKGWVVNKAAELQKTALQNKEGANPVPQKEEERRGDSIKEGVPGVAAEVTLTRQGGDNQSLTVQRLLPTNLIEKRKQRIEKALADKCPKLQEAKGGGKTSILLLEMLEDRISNHRDIAGILTELLPAREDNPDEIYLAATKKVPWKVYLLKEGEDLFPETEDPGPHLL